MTIHSCEPSLPELKAELENLSFYLSEGLLGFLEEKDKIDRYNIVKAQIERRENAHKTEEVKA